MAAEVELVSKSQEGHLRIDLDYALQLLQRREVEAHLGSRFGLHGMPPVSDQTAASPESLLKKASGLHWTRLGSRVWWSNCSEGLGTVVIGCSGEQGTCLQVGEL